MISLSTQRRKEGQDIEIPIILHNWLHFGFCCHVLGKSTIHEKKTPETQRRSRKTPRKEVRGNKGDYLFNSDNLLHSLCNSCLGSSYERCLPAVSPADVRWRRHSICSGVLLLESKSRKSIENQGSQPGTNGHTVRLFKYVFTIIGGAALPQPFII